MRTWRSVRAEYDHLRRRYYLDAEDPLRIPPLAADPALRWAWTKSPKDWAATHLDEDGDPYMIEVPFGQGSRLTCLMLLHELSHMRNPDAHCGSRSRWWREEGRRLEAAGAFGREGIF